MKRDTVRPSVDRVQNAQALRWGRDDEAGHSVLWGAEAKGAVDVIVGVKMQPSELFASLVIDMQVAGVEANRRAKGDWLLLDARHDGDAHRDIIQSAPLCLSIQPKPFCPRIASALHQLRYKARPRPLKHSRQCPSVPRRGLLGSPNQRRRVAAGRAMRHFVRPPSLARGASRTAWSGPTPWRP